jgi:hypothetical protein
MAQLAERIAAVSTERLRQMKVQLLTLEIGMMERISQYMVTESWSNLVESFKRYSSGLDMLPTKLRENLCSFSAEEETAANATKVLLLLSSVSTLIGAVTSELYNRQLEMAVGHTQQDFGDF